MKSEPFKYSWDQLVKDGKTYWDGVRNYEARNNLSAMKMGDLALYYHSNEGKEVVGIAEIVRAMVAMMDGVDAMMAAMRTEVVGMRAAMAIAETAGAGRSAL